MDDNNNTPSGSHESHGGASAAVQLCHRCRWPFPNPHPSAKHRRAHKRVCGTIQGYKLDTDMDPTLSDDDHSQTPCTKPSGGIGERSNRSEDELFSDAVTEFSDSGFSHGVEEHPRDVKVATATGDKDLAVFYSFKDNAADLIEQSSNSTVSSQIGNPEVPENATAFPGSDLVSQVVSSTTEESAGENVREGLMTYVGQETDTEGKDKVNPDRNVVPFLPSEYPGQTSEAESKCQETEKKSTDLVPAAEVVLSKEEHGTEMASKMCSGDPMPRVESLKLSDAADTAQNKVVNERGLDFVGSINSNEGFIGKEEGNENVYELSVPADIHIVDHAETMLEEFKDRKGVKSHQPVTLDNENVNELSVPADIPVVDHAETMLEGFKDHKGVKSHQPVTLDNENVYELSVPADIPVVDHAETMLEGFKDHKGVKSHQPVTLDSSEIIKDKKDDFEDSPSEVITKVSASDVHTVEDNFIHKDSMPEVEKPSSQEENDEPQIKLTSKEGLDELGVSAAAITMRMEKSNLVSSMENQQPSDVSDDPLHMAVQETAVKGLYDVNPTGASSEASVIGLHDIGNHENLTSEICNVSEKDEKERVKEEYFAENIITTYSATILPEFRGSPATNLHGSDDAGDHDKHKIEKCGVGVENKEEPSEGTPLLESQTAESDNLHEAHDVTEDARDVSVMKLSETKLTNTYGVSDTQDDPKQLEFNGNDKAEGECDAKHDRDIVSVERTSVDHETKASLLSPLDTESSVQDSVAVDDNYAVEQGTGHSGINQPSQEENDDNVFIKHQFGASAIDVSVDSLSQTDSLEGNWGSISVLSTQSDIPAAIDAEKLSSDDNLAAAKAELNSKKPEGVTERQRSEKSDVFEAPSFMTLVEPGRSDEKAAVSDMQTIPNLQQKNPSQAGWFPSLTNVVNDSQGRKKNEERIAKVTNWSTGKQHTPLKNLLSEANLETKPKSPNPKENKANVIHKNETAAKDNGAVPMTVSTILGPEAPAAEPAKRETGKEVNSPSTYPTEIKREKRKVKGKPFWVQFVCCSYVN